MKQYIVDAFAQAPFQGNPAAICLPRCWPDAGLMQRIAAENHLPETAFVVPAGDAYAIRWFTPRYEIDLCGHATLAAAFVLHRFVAPGQEEFLFTSQSGPLRVRCGPGFTLDFPARPPRPVPPPPALEEALGTAVKEVYLSRDLMAVVSCEAVVRGLRPDFAKLAALEAGDGVIVTAKGDACDFVSRCFYPKSGVDEDPVTGSAHCNLIPYWSARLGKRRLSARQLSPRGGTLSCRDGGDRVYIGGDAVLYACCELNITE